MIGLKIKNDRIRQGMSQSQLAGDDLSRAYISIIESGKAIPSAKILALLAERLGRPLHYFSDDVEETDEEICYAILNRLDNDFLDFDPAVKLLNKVLHLSKDKHLLGTTFLRLFDLFAEHQAFEDILLRRKEAQQSLLDHPDKSLIVRLHMIIAKAFFRTERFLEAKRYYTSALLYGRPQKKCQYEVTQTLIFLGTTNLRLGDIPQAHIHYKEALAHMEYTNFEDLRANIYLGLGKTYSLTGQEQKALHYTNLSLQGFEDIGDQAGAHIAFQNLLILNDRNNSIEYTVEHLQQLYDLYQGRNPFKEASVLEEFAIIHLRSKQYEDAKQFVIRAVQVLEDKNLVHSRALYYSLYGVLEKLLGNENTGNLLIRSSLDLFSRIDARHDVSICQQLLDCPEYRDLGEYFLSLHARGEIFVDNSLGTLS
ncbi:hypothetical protein ASF99_01740 [Exiguobacterium sp. Leaf187]|uniref:helix-turn-helix transcriptional regulator n=1 Tax=Exiguobacterium sp. Leaf187 TaxID=1736294 RepID=UPI0006F82AE8|nr:helix-turn-helix transcriptional regulator [Exiguobacterium sp. Leaf187]KQS18638.1 hypothetical protein ASF99_01740 [Exiguobacterium sp. Leaf187]